MSLKAFLLCAGEGTRFRPYTSILPKPLIPFLNVPLCAYNLYLLKMLGVQNIIANTHVHSPLLEKELGFLAHLAGLPPPAFSFEETLLGSAGGLLKVKDFFIPKGYNYSASYKEKHLGRLTSKSRNFKGHQYKPEPFFYLNGDSFIWPETEGSLLDFYSSHLQSGALASFLVWPASNMTIDSPCLSPPSSVESDSSQSNIKKSYIYAEDERVCSFSKPPERNTKAKPYAFLGLAVFSPQIFNEIEQARNARGKIDATFCSDRDSVPSLTRYVGEKEAIPLHIFKDVLNPLAFKGHLRVHSVQGTLSPSGQVLPPPREFTSTNPLSERKEAPLFQSRSTTPPTWELDMNQLSTYLQGTQIALDFLMEQRRDSPRWQSLSRGGTGFLQQALDLYTPDWRRYEGDQWFSAEPVKNPPSHKEDILFCGKGVRGLQNLSVKGFAVLGEGAFLAKPLLIKRAVLGKNGHLNTDLQNTLKL